MAETVEVAYSGRGMGGWGGGMLVVLFLFAREHLLVDAVPASSASV